MFFACNTTVTIYGDYTTTDEWGDEVDADIVADSGISASITEFDVRGQMEVTTRPFVQRRATARFYPADQDKITQNCRIKDETTGRIWLIVDISYPNNYLGHQPRRYDLVSAD